ncbi:major capsid protein [Nonomuraea dietziae]|uniref:major capsid protein n=1 Tax=Nonomuraea dietziae TaxID=65515 RepID=UPI003444AB74
MSLPFQHELIINDSSSGTEGTRAVILAADQSRMPANPSTGERNIVASGGWCAPSETVYELTDIACPEMLWDLPESQLARGGLRYFTIPSLDVASMTFVHTEADGAGSGCCSGRVRIRARSRCCCGRRTGPAGTGWTSTAERRGSGRHPGCERAVSGKGRSPGSRMRIPGLFVSAAAVRAARSLAERVQVGLLPTVLRAVSPCAGSGGPSAERTSP